MSSKKPLAQPNWVKNTYFWIAAALFVLGVIGLVSGDNVIRDPGQKREGYLWLLYLAAAVIMLVNGLISHRQTVQQYREETEQSAT